MGNIKNTQNDIEDTQIIKLENKDEIKKSSKKKFIKNAILFSLLIVLSKTLKYTFFFLVVFVS